MAVAAPPEVPQTPEGVRLLRNKDTGHIVGVEDTRRPSVTSRIVMMVIAIIAAVGWGMVGLSRGETVNSVWIVCAAVGSYIIAYTFYARLIAYKVVKPRDDRATPAEEHADGKDFVPTDRRVLFGHHFAAIAGAGPLVGPVMAAQMGYLPSTLWIVLGVIFAGAVQDYLVLWISTRRKGRSLGQMVRDEMGTIGGAAGILAVMAIMIIIIAVLALVVVNALAHSPWGVFLHRHDHPHRLVHGRVHALPASRAHRGGLRHRRRPAAAGHHCRWLGG